jgi:hypothetical protein
LKAGKFPFSGTIAYLNKRVPRGYVILESNPLYNDKYSQISLVGYCFSEHIDHLIASTLHEINHNLTRGPLCRKNGSIN